MIFLWRYDTINAGRNQVLSKKRTSKKIRRMIRKQLGYVKRDLGYLKAYIDAGYSLNNKYNNNYLVIHLAIEADIILLLLSWLDLLHRFIYRPTLSSIAMSILVTNLFSTANATTVPFFILYFADGAFRNKNNQFIIFEDVI